MACSIKLLYNLYHLNKFGGMLVWILLMCDQFVSCVSSSSARPPHSSVARGRLPAVTAWYEGRGTPNLFILGTSAHSRDYRMSAGGFIHGFRYTGLLFTHPLCKKENTMSKANVLLKSLGE